MSNVLLTCAGRRNYLVGYFRQALAARGKVLAADAAETAPALQEADLACIVPPVQALDYIDTLLEICSRHGVRLLLSLNDLELPLLAREKERFLAIGTFPVVSPAPVIDLCFDKLETWRFLRSECLGAPYTCASLEEVRKALDRGDLHWPLVLKPRWGTASVGIEYPESWEELELAWRLGRLRLPRTLIGGVSAADPEQSLLVQEKLRGAEYGLDIVNDLQGRYVATFVRRKLAMRSGETDQAITESAPLLEALGRRIGEALGHIGNLDCDLFVDGDEVKILEMNPRFGGGYPFSHQAGANLPAALIAWVEGRPADPGWLSLRPGIAAAKCDRLVTVNGSDCIRPWLRRTEQLRQESAGETVADYSHLPG